MRADLTRELNRKHGGFTLVELLVSVVLTTLICLMVAEVTARSVQTVGMAAGKMTATEKLGKIRQVLGDDLAALPRMELDELLNSEGSAGSKWSLALLLPEKKRDSQAGYQQLSWRKVNYRWDSAKGTLWRQVNDEAETVVVTGVLDLQVNWAVDWRDTGMPNWTAASLPEAARIKARLTGVWEEGEREDVSSADEKGREFAWVLPVGAL